MAKVSKEIQTAAIIPAFNEGPRISGVIHASLLSECIDAVVVIDDGSSDYTADLANFAIKSLEGNYSKPIELESHKQNMGKTEALITGIARACEIGGTALKTLVFLDADSSPIWSRDTRENMKLWQVGISKMSANPAQLLTPELLQGRNEAFVTLLARYIDEIAEPVVSGREIMRVGMYQRNVITDTLLTLLQQGGHGGNRAIPRDVWEDFITEIDNRDIELDGWEIEGALTSYVSKLRKQDPTLQQGAFMMHGIVNVGSRVKAGNFFSGMNRMRKIHTQAARGLTRFRS